MKKKSILTICTILLALIFAGLLAFLYRTEWQKTPVLQAESPDGSCLLTVYQKGEPDFPYGAAHCVLKLQEDGKNICSADVDVYNDGGNAEADNFDIAWENSSVTVTVSSEEGEDIVLTLNRQ